MGTRHTYRLVKFQPKDHPHAYGDKVYFTKETIQKIGSSPRVWGQVGIPYSFDINEGIIPTRMGTRISKSPFGGFG